jgi:hypothetical protein
MSLNILSQGMAVLELSLREGGLERLPGAAEIERMSHSEKLGLISAQQRVIAAFKRRALCQVQSLQFRMLKAQGDIAALPDEPAPAPRPKRPNWRPILASIARLSHRAEQAASDGQPFVALARRVRTVPDDGGGHEL